MSRGVRAFALASTLSSVGCNDVHVSGTMSATIDGTSHEFTDDMTLRNLSPGMLVQGTANDGSGYVLLVVAPTNELPGTYACDQSLTDRNVVLMDPSGAKHLALDGGSCSFTVTNAEDDGDSVVAFSFTATIPNGTSTYTVSGDAEVTGAR